MIQILVICGGYAPGLQTLEAHESLSILLQFNCQYNEDRLWELTNHNILTNKLTNHNAAYSCWQKLIPFVLTSELQNLSRNQTVPRLAVV